MNKETTQLQVLDAIKNINLNVGEIVVGDITVESSDTVTHTKLDTLNTTVTNKTLSKTTSSIDISGQTVAISNTGFNSTNILDTPLITNYALETTLGTTNDKLDTLNTTVTNKHLDKTTDSVDISGQTLVVNTIEGYATSALQTAANDVLNTISAVSIAINDNVIKIVDRSGDIQANIYYTQGAQVWADSVPTPTVNVLDPNGWLYTNTNAGNAMNLFYFNGANEIRRLEDVTGQYAVVSNLSTKINDKMIFGIYTKSGSSFFTTRITHSQPSGGVMVAGGKYLLFWGDAPTDLYPNLPRIDLTDVVTTGPANPLEEVLAVSLNSDSGATAGDLSISIEVLGVLFNGESRSYNLLGSPTEYETLVNIKTNSDKLKYTGDDLKVIVSNFPTSFEVSNFPTTQPVSGTVSLSSGSVIKISDGVDTADVVPINTAMIGNQDKGLATVSAVYGALRNEVGLQLSQPITMTIIGDSGPSKNALDTYDLRVDTKLTTVNTSIGTTNTTLSDIKTNSDKLKYTGDDLKVIVSNFPTSFEVENFPTEQVVSGTVDIGTLPAIAITNTSFEVSNFPTEQVVSGTVDIGTLPAIAITNTSFEVSNFPTEQVVSGTVDVATLPAIAITNTSFEVSNFPTEQVVSGTVDVATLPAIAITNTSFEVSNFPTEQVVSGTVDVATLPAIEITNTSFESSLVDAEGLKITTTSSGIEPDLVRALDVNITNATPGNPLSVTIDPTVVVTTTVNNFPTTTQIVVSGDTPLSAVASSLYTNLRDTEGDPIGVDGNPLNVEVSNTVVVETGTNSLNVNITGGTITGADGKAYLYSGNEASAITATTVGAKVGIDSNIINASIDTHCYGSSNGTTWHHLATDANGQLNVHSKTQDGEGTDITSSLIGSKQSLDVNVANTTAIPVSGTFFQATQPVSGTVGITGTVPVSGTFFQATQPVSIASTVAVSDSTTQSKIDTTNSTLSTINGKVPSGLSVSSSRLLTNSQLSAFNNSTSTITTLTCVQPVSTTGVRALDTINYNLSYNEDTGVYVPISSKTIGSTYALNCYNVKVETKEYTFGGTDNNATAYRIIGGLASSSGLPVDLYNFGLANPRVYYASLSTGTPNSNLFIDYVDGTTGDLVESAVAFPVVATGNTSNWTLLPNMIGGPIKLRTSTSIGGTDVGPPDTTAYTLYISPTTNTNRSICSSNIANYGIGTFTIPNGYIGYISALTADYSASGSLVLAKWNVNGVRQVAYKFMVGSTTNLVVSAGYEGTLGGIFTAGETLAFYSSSAITNKMVQANMTLRAI
jgi:hypothetical protein